MPTGVCRPNVIYHSPAIAPCWIVMPSHGSFRRCLKSTILEYKRRPGDRVGHNWRVPNVHGKRAVRHVVYDTNYWKSFSVRTTVGPLGDRGCLSLFVTRRRCIGSFRTSHGRITGSKPKGVVEAVDDGSHVRSVETTTGSIASSVVRSQPQCRCGSERIHWGCSPE